MPPPLDTIPMANRILDGISVFGNLKQTGLSQKKIQNKANQTEYS